jgi:hypothetical protein
MSSPVVQKMRQEWSQVGPRLVRPSPGGPSTQELTRTELTIKLAAIRRPAKGKQSPVRLGSLAGASAPHSGEPLTRRPTAQRVLPPGRRAGPALWPPSGRLPNAATYSSTGEVRRGWVAGRLPRWNSRRRPSGSAPQPKHVCWCCRAARRRPLPCHPIGVVGGGRWAGPAWALAHGAGHRCVGWVPCCCACLHQRQSVERRAGGST